MNDGITGSARRTRIAVVGNHLPRRCGIATFTTDLTDALTREEPTLDCVVVAMNDPGKDYDYPTRVRFEIAQSDLHAYRAAARYINHADVDGVSVQHEYGIFGGTAGDNLLELLRGLTVPVVTTFHTLLPAPDRHQRDVLEGIARLSDRVVVMSQAGATLLMDVHGIDAAKIDIIPHGRPSLPVRRREVDLDLDGKSVILTFGLLGPDKGLEYVIDALPAICNRHPDVMYVILGVTHPHVKAQQGETYRRMLEARVLLLGVSDHVRFIDRFVEQDELVDYIAAADIYVTPYLNDQQSTSGTLAYAVGCGKAVISTPYRYAQELLSDGRGILVKPRSAAALAVGVIGLLDGPDERAAMQARAASYGAMMGWPTVARRYLDTLAAARRTFTESCSSGPVHATPREKVTLPPLDLSHVRLMTDDTGLLQHATFDVPCYSDGYCLDDNARALLLMARLEEENATVSKGFASDFKSTARSLSTRFLAFVNHAFDEKTGRFRNFLTYSRQWHEGDGSEDSHARALWSLGTVIGRSTDHGRVGLAQRLFHGALPATSALTSPRAWAYALLGIDEYSRQFAGDDRTESVRAMLAAKLVDRFHHSATLNWPWFEDRLTYCNARLSQALIVSAPRLGDPDMAEIGTRSLAWLIDQHIGAEGHFAPVGSNGFFVRMGARADYDQQPVEACTMVSACLDASRVLGTRSHDNRLASSGRQSELQASCRVAGDDAEGGRDVWFDAAERAFAWYLGGNSRNARLYDDDTGGCRDGIHIDRLNENQGAESTLSFLMALSEMRRAIAERTPVPRSLCERLTARDGALLGTGDLHHDLGSDRHND